MSKNWLWVIPAVIIGSFFNAKCRKEEREQMKAAEEEIENGQRNLYMTALK